MKSWYDGIQVSLYFFLAGSNRLRRGRLESGVDVEEDHTIRDGVHDMLCLPVSRIVDDEMDLHRAVSELRATSEPREELRAESTHQRRLH